MNIVETMLNQQLLERDLIVLRIFSRAWHGPDVRHQLDRIRPKNAEKFLRPSCGVSDCVDHLEVMGDGLTRNTSFAST